MKVVLFGMTVLTMFHVAFGESNRDVESVHGATTIEGSAEVGISSPIYGDSDEHWGCCGESLAVLHGIRFRELVKSGSRSRQKFTAESATIVDAWLSMGSMQPKSSWTPLQHRFYEAFDDDSFWEKINDLQLRQGEIESELMNNLRKQWEVIYGYVVSKGVLSQEEWDVVSEKLKAATTPEERNAVLWHYLKDKHPQRESR